MQSWQRIERYYKNGEHNILTGYEHIICLHNMLKNAEIWKNRKHFTGIKGYKVVIPVKIGGCIIPHGMI